MKATVILIVLALGFFPAAAWANAGIGFLLPSVPALLLALVPAIIIEAPVLAGMLRVGVKRGFMLSLKANLMSTACGVGAALLIDLVLYMVTGSMGPVPSGEWVLKSLVPMYFLTMGIEGWFIAREAREISVGRVAFAAIAANTLSYALLVSFLAGTSRLESSEKFGDRDRVYVATGAARPLQDRVEAYWVEHKRLPERASDIGRTEFAPRPNVSAVIPVAGGRINMELSFPNNPDLNGKRLLFVPYVDDGKRVLWRCSAPGVPVHYLISCRDDQK